MAFITTRLPMEVEIGATRRDVEDIGVVTTDGGWEVRNARAAQSLMEYDISFPMSLRTGSIYLQVLAMYKAARGQLHGFLFRDWANYQLTAANIGTGNGVTTAFQIVQKWTAGSETHSRKITRPVSAIGVYKAGVLQVSGYSVSYSTGIVTFTSAPLAAVAITVTGEFDVPVRFDTPLETLGYSSELEHIETMTLREVRE